MYSFGCIGLQFGVPKMHVRDYGNTLYPQGREVPSMKNTGIRIDGL